MTVWCGIGVSETPNSAGNDSESSATVRRLHFYLRTELLSQPEEVW